MKLATSELRQIELIEKSMITAFEEGQQARDSNNPYHTSDPKYKEWCNGFCYKIAERIGRVQ
jgi:butyrate kinase